MNPLKDLILKACRITRNAGWGQATTAKVARIWREEGLKIPQKQPPSGRR